MALDLKVQPDFPIGIHKSVTDLIERLCGFFFYRIVYCLKRYDNVALYQLLVVILNCTDNARNLTLKQEIIFLNLLSSYYDNFI